MGRWIHLNVATHEEQVELSESHNSITMITLEYNDKNETFLAIKIYFQH